MYFVVIRLINKKQLSVKSNTIFFELKHKPELENHRENIFNNVYEVC